VAVALDPWLTGWIRAFGWAPLLPWVQAVTWLGYGALDAAGVALLAAAGWRRGDRHLIRRGLWGAATVALAGLGTQLVKNLACRARPSAPGAGAFLVDFPCVPAGYGVASFPSGHATTAFAAALLLGLWYPRWRAPLLVLAGLVGLSRVVLGSHFPSDILGGALLGTGAALLGWRWIDRDAAEGVRREE
jgi:undecaprenyl-diphosphatase